VALAVFVFGAEASAALAQAGWYVTPSLSVAGEFDDNVFVSSTNPKSDYITRFTPGIELGYKSEPFTILASSSIDSEIYADNSDLDNVANRKRAGLAVKYLPYRLLTLGLDVHYLETNTPADVVLTTGLQLARTRATELDVLPAATYQLTAVDTLKGSYEYTRDTLEGSPDNNTHRIRLGYARQLTPLDTGMINYRLSLFESTGASTTITNAPTLGWVRQLTPNTLLTLEGGPRFVDNDGVVEPEAHGRIDHTFKVAKVALDYLRSEAVVVGRPGKVELESITGMVEIEPLRSLTVRFEPGYYRTFDGVDPTARVYGFVLSALYPIQSWLSARLAYRFAYQEQGPFTLHHDIVTLSLDAAYPYRVSP